MKNDFQNIRLSLLDLLGEDYCSAVCEARGFLSGRPKRELLALVREKTDFWPAWYQNRLEELLASVGQQATTPLQHALEGAATHSFAKASCLRRAPLSGLGCIRIGQDGKAYFIAKSEHYHASLGHGFPGHQLLEKARALGIPNATHNNTRGYITRLSEVQLIAAANGLKTSHDRDVDSMLAGVEPGVLNRVINLETGSLAVEAGLKMMLARFFDAGSSRGKPPHADQIPVFLVMGDHSGAFTANYHGTTLLAQMLRGMWPDLYKKHLHDDVFLVRPLRINDYQDFRAAVEKYDSGRYKVAGFLHEIILMNYGGIKLEQDYLKQAYDLCRSHDIPVLADEIQSCVWSPEVFLFREYGLHPDLVAVGKGFPGGECPASRILTTAPMDNLNQFDALVTNGQEEIASLSYLVTLQFLSSNRDAIRSVGEHYESELRNLAKKHSGAVVKIEGLRHMSSIYFSSVGTADRFASLLNGEGIDISAQTYKPECPPSALTKLPLVTTHRMVDFLIEKMDDALKRL